MAIFSYIISSSETHIGVGTLIDIMTEGDIEDLKREDEEGTYVIDMHGTKYYFYDYRCTDPDYND